LPSIVALNEALHPLSPRESLQMQRFYTAKVIKRLADRASRSAGLHPEPDNAAAGGGGVTRAASSEVGWG